MSTATTAISWTDRTWNPIRGCSRVSPGCNSCYAMGQAHRFAGEGKPFHGLTVIRNDRVDWTGVARFVPEALAEPLSWRRPSLIFVNSMSDLFHHSVTNEEIAAVFGVMAASPRHIFQVLTKRPERMREWFAWLKGAHATCAEPAEPTFCVVAAQRACERMPSVNTFALQWPLPNVWIGVSAEDQERWDERKRFIHDVPAAVHFASFEPLLGPIDLKATGRIHLGWAIVGGESGAGARPCDVSWIRSLVEQCHEAAVPAFVKQLGARPVQPREFGLGHPLTLMEQSDRKGADPSEWPEDLRVQQMPPIPFARTRPEVRAAERHYRILWRGTGIWGVEAPSPERAIELAVEVTGKPADELEAYLEGSAAVALARAGRVTAWEASRC